ncbi:MAG TPA: PEP-CTERM sorting domain-containing protein [Bryobacteraceae bacterium]|nr:PEP-CTERM sorting domain-containing protein [Bryobacteraceae bacterium]
MTGSDTIGFMQIGGTVNDPCLQAGPQYCTNGGGIVTVAGTTGIGGTSTFSGTFNGTAGTWNYGSLIMEISGEGAVQVFAANAADGLGSATPPTGLTLAATPLSGLGFGSFTSAANPTVTFLMADTLYTDNTRQFVLSQASVPEPSSIWLLGSALVGLAAFGRRALLRRG